jgi:two-component system sensor histidine kinase RpfC
MTAGNISAECAIEYNKRVTALPGVTGFSVVMRYPADAGAVTFRRVDLLAMSHEVRYTDSLRAQARLRAALSIPIIGIGMGMLHASGAISSAALILAAMQVAYFTSILALARFGSPAIHKPASYVTAVADPLVLSAWLPMVGEFGPVISAFYLFTVLGYGFRTSVAHMHLCQAVSIAAMTLVLAVTPFWQANRAVWLGVVTTLIVVPLYAAALLRLLHAARARAEDDSRAKSDLLARVSHELRTPLTGIVSAAELIASQDDEPKSAQRATTILTLSAELLTEINNLLDESKHSSGGIVLRPAPFAMQGLADLLHATFDTVADRKGIEFRVLMDPRLPAYVEADSHYLLRVLVNLAGNAVKFTNTGVVRVTVERGGSDDASTIRFSVEDTGPGIPREYQKDIFAPFFQVTKGPVRQQGGTGLGLSIAHAAVAAMGGALQVDSEVGKGSRFWFTVRLPASAPPGSGAAPSRADDCRVARRVLVVDDNRTNLELLKEMLEADGHDVVTAQAGMEALEKLASSPHMDLIVLDFNLPDMDGAEVLKTYRFGCKNPVPAYFLTADATRVTQAHLFASGAAGVLTKPLRQDDLRRLIGSLAQQVQSAGGSPDAVPATRVARPILTAVETPVLDPANLRDLALLSTDPGFAQRILATAQDDIRRNADDLRQALSRGEWLRARDAAHALKGVAASIGAMRMAAIGSRVLKAKDADLRAHASAFAASLAKEEPQLADAVARYGNPPPAAVSGD